MDKAWQGTKTARDAISSKEAGTFYFEEGSATSGGPAVSPETGATIKTKLEGLTGTARLASTAIKGLRDQIVFALPFLNLDKGWKGTKTARDAISVKEAGTLYFEEGSATSGGPAVSPETGATIKTKLEMLTGVARLASTAIKGIRDQVVFSTPFRNMDKAWSGTKTARDAISTKEENTFYFEEGSSGGSGSVVSPETGATIKTKLEMLTGVARLASTAIKGIRDQITFTTPFLNMDKAWKGTKTQRDAISSKETATFYFEEGSAGSSTGGGTTETGATIKTKLEGLTGTARLASTAIKGLRDQLVFTTPFFNTDKGWSGTKTAREALTAETKTLYFEEGSAGANFPPRVTFGTSYPSSPSAGDVFFYTGASAPLSNPELTAGSIFVRVGTNWVKQLVSLSR